MYKIQRIGVWTQKRRDWQGSWIISACLVGPMEPSPHDVNLRPPFILGFPAHVRKSCSKSQLADGTGDIAVAANEDIFEDIKVWVPGDSESDEWLGKKMCERKQQKLTMIQWDFPKIPKLEVPNIMPVQGQNWGNMPHTYPRRPFAMRSKPLHPGPISWTWYQVPGNQQCHQELSPTTVEPFWLVTS